MNSFSSQLRQASYGLLLIITAVLGLSSLEAIAGNTPCSGRKGGIAGCDSRVNNALYIDIPTKHAILNFYSNRTALKMKIKLINYSIENPDSRSVFADILISADGIEPIRWHIIPIEWNLSAQSVICSSGIGAPIDSYDLDSLSAEARSILLGERYSIDDIVDFEALVAQALRSEFSSIRREVAEALLIALETELEEYEIT